MFVAGMGAFAWKACATDEPPKQTDGTVSPAPPEGAPPLGTHPTPAADSAGAAGPGGPVLPLIKSRPPWLACGGI